MLCIGSSGFDTNILNSPLMEGSRCWVSGKETKNLKCQKTHFSRL